MSILCEIVRPAKLENLPVCLETIKKCALNQGLSLKKISDLELAAEEALVNIINYAYSDIEGEVRIVCRRDRQHLIIEIIDSGTPFNPLTKEHPDLSIDIDERSIGGLGVFLIKTLIDEMEYQRKNNQNILTLVVYAEQG